MFFLQCLFQLLFVMQSCKSVKFIPKILQLRYLKHLLCGSELSSQTCQHEAYSCSFGGTFLLEPLGNPVQFRENLSATVSWVNAVKYCNTAVNNCVPKKIQKSYVDLSRGHSYLCSFTAIGPWIMFMQVNAAGMRDCNSSFSFHSLIYALWLKSPYRDKSSSLL